MSCITPARAQVLGGIAWMDYIRGEYDEAQEAGAAHGVPGKHA